MELLKEVKDILHPFGELDLLYYYSIVAGRFQDFLKDKEIAAKIHLSGKVPKLLKRGSQLTPLFAPDLAQVDADFLKLRVGHHLKDIRGKLTPRQILLWEYFFPRKMIEFFYACNNEHPGLPIERIFIDVDKGKHIASEVVQEATLSLVHQIREDMEFNKLAKYRPVILWTGNSFHVYLLLEEKVPSLFYKQYLSYGDDKKNSGNFPARWARQITASTGIRVEAGHEKTEDHLILDTSGTPSGKLARAPFSLHIKNYQEFDGIAVPLSLEDLKKRNLIKDLRKLTPEKVVKNLDRYAELL